MDADKIPMTPELLDLHNRIAAGAPVADWSELEELAKAATTGPWRWELNEKNRDISLCGGRPTFDKTVMDFTRYGFNGAAPRFQDKSRGGMCMERADKFGVEVKGRLHHADWFKTIDNPDACYIAAASPDKVLALLDENARLRAALAERDKPEYFVEPQELLNGDTLYGPYTSVLDNE